MFDGPPAADWRLDRLYFFCRLQAPAIALSVPTCRAHLERTHTIFQKKQNCMVSWETYLDHLYPLDWYVVVGCLEGLSVAWERMFASRAGRSDCLLLDALRARAARLYPRDEERQDSAVSEFWASLITSSNPETVPILARYDGQRPLVPWLIRVFQNWHISLLRKQTGTQALPEDDLGLPLPEPGVDSQWREVFAQATREWLGQLSDDERLLLGLRMRNRLSQREVSQVLQVHEGTISRRNDQLRESCLEFLGKRLTEEGWTGENLFELIRSEMHSLLLEDASLSADALAKILHRKGKRMPA